MIKRIIERLKSIEQVRTAGKKIKETAAFLAGIRKRDAAVRFHSPRVALRKSRQPFLPSQKYERTINSIQNNELRGISTYQEVLAYPMQKGRKREYSGGLVNKETGKLIETAIHLGDKGQFTQEEPFIEDQVPENELLHIEQTVLYAGIMFHHFGHFLLESLGRLWAYNQVKELNPFILFYNDALLPPYLEKTSFVHQVLKGFNIPPEKLLFINQPALLKRVIIPEQKYGFTFRPHPDETFIKFIQSFRIDLQAPEHFRGAEKIYVSRSKITIGRVIGENSFEDYLAHEGYKIFHPELYTLNQQLTVYQQAAKLIFCDGSAIHACILLPDIKADIAVIARRYDRHSTASNILCQFDGYNKKTLWIDCVKEQYQFGLESWHALTVVDWCEVTVTLKKEYFVDDLYLEFNEIDHSSLLHTEMRNYLEAIKDYPEYSEYMITQKSNCPLSVEVKCVRII